MRGATYYSHELPCSMEMTIENGLDPSHFPFAHHGVISKRSDAAPLSMTVRTCNVTHLDLETSYERNGKFRERLYSFQRPVLLCTQEKRPIMDGQDPSSTSSTTTTVEWRQTSKFFVVPIREGRSRLITSVEKLSQPWLPDWITHWATGRLFEGDYFLHQAERNRRMGQGRTYLQPTRADHGPRAWNRWWKEHGMARAPPHTFGPASSGGQHLKPLSKRELYDHWQLHTATCSKCRKVLRRARKMQGGSLLAGVMLAAWKVQQSKLAWATTIVILSSTISWLSKRLVRRLEGSTHASDIPDRSYSLTLD